LLKFECRRPHRHPIVVRRDPQQFELCFPVMEGLGYPSAFFGAVAIPATERNIITYSHGARFTALCLFTYRLNPAIRRVVPWLKGKRLPGLGAALLQSHWHSGGWGASSTMSMSKYSIRSFSSKQDKHQCTENCHPNCHPIIRDRVATGSIKRDGGAENSNRSGLVVTT
jgi:hypothetical protein